MPKTHDPPNPTVNTVTVTVTQLAYGRAYVALKERLSISNHWRLGMRGRQSWGPLWRIPLYIYPNDSHIRPYPLVTLKCSDAQTS